MLHLELKMGNIKKIHFNRIKPAPKSLIPKRKPIFSGYGLRSKPQHV